MKRTPGDSELLTLNQAAERLGWKATRRRRKGGLTLRAERLLRVIEGREAESGKRIMQRRPGPLRCRRTRLVTMLALREHVPELFPGERSRLADEGRFKQVLRSIDERIAEQTDPINEKLAVVEYNGLVTRGMVEELGERVCAVTGAKPLK